MKMEIFDFWLGSQVNVENKMKYPKTVASIRERILVVKIMAAVGDPASVTVTVAAGAALSAITDLGTG